jgi:hypothetical protein
VTALNDERPQTPMNATKVRASDPSAATLSNPESLRSGVEVASHGHEWGTAGLTVDPCAWPV